MMVAVIVVSGIAAGLAALLVFAEKVISNYGECVIDINDGTRTLTVQGGASLLNCLTEEKLFIPSACGGKATCGYCKVKVLAGAGPLLPTEEPFLTPEERTSNVRLSCQIKVREDIRIQIPEELFLVKEYRCTVESITDLTHDIKAFRFKLIEPETIDFIPGQYMQLYTPEYEKSSEEVYRAYSMSCDPKDPTAIELVVRLVPGGICTTYCFDYMKAGAQAYLNGPYGEFRLSETHAPMIMIAGGSGMAPIKCLLHHMENNRIARKATYFFGANKVNELFYRDVMQRFEDVLPDFTFVPVVAQPETEWEGDKGLVTEAVNRHCQDLSDHEAYLCGSPGMIDASIVTLTQHGMLEESIYYDKFA
jgi:Na+-transporting NADH:ubiquinone oxidoreductase subunit F